MRYYYKDFATNEVHYTNGKFTGWSKPTGLLNVRYAGFTRKSDTLWIPEYLLSKETLQALESIVSIQKSGGTLSLTPTVFTLDLSRARNPHIALFQLANILEQHTGYWLDFREQPNGQVTEWMLMDKHGVAHKATGTPRTVVIPLA